MNEPATTTVFVERNYFRILPSAIIQFPTEAALPDFKKEDA
jgi:hypothetical protein